MPVILTGGIDTTAAAVVALSRLAKMHEQRTGVKLSLSDLRAVLGTRAVRRARSRERHRMPHAWVPCGYQTRTLATLLPTCVCKLHQSRLTPCGEFVHDGLVATLARCSLPSRAPLAELVVCDCQ